jgi:hypothetical protein
VSDGEAEIDNRVCDDGSGNKRGQLVKLPLQFVKFGYARPGKNAGV